eukprot:6189833-Pleurochrysis_carterae.AAC.2
MEAGYRLKVLSYFSKSFNFTQRNWATSDKEAVSIIWPLLTCTDSSPTGIPWFTQLLLACKVPRPPRLERWGVVFGTHLPHLRVPYRIGGKNLVTDEPSRFVTQVEYKHKPEYKMEVPDDLYDRSVYVTHRGRLFKLAEAKDIQMLQKIWKSADSLKRDDLNTN